MATLQELEQGLIAADAAGNTDDAKVFADEIRRMRGQSMSPLGMAAEEASRPIPEDAPSMAGSAGRELLRSAAPTGVGFLGGAGAGALAGMAGGPFAPVTVPLAALGGGLISAMGARSVQDAVADEFAPDSMFGTKSSTLDYQTNPGSTLVGGLVAGGKPSVGRVLTAGKSLVTAEGRQILGQAIGTLGKREAVAALQHSNPAALNALGDVIDVASGAGIGAGMSLASGESLPMVGANLLGGAVFNKPWIGGSKAVLPEPIPAGNGPMIAPAENGPAPMRDVTPVPAPEAPPVVRGPMPHESPLSAGPAGDQLIQQALNAFRPTVDPSRPSIAPENPMVQREMANRLTEIAPKDAEGNPVDAGIPAQEQAPIRGGGAPMESADALRLAMESAMRRNPEQPLPEPAQKAPEKHIAEQFELPIAEPQPLPSNEPNRPTPELQPRIAPQDNPNPQLADVAPPVVEAGQVRPVVEGAGGIGEDPTGLSELGGAGRAITDNFYRGIEESLTKNGRVPSAEANTRIGKAWEAVKTHYGSDPEVVPKFVSALREASAGGDTPQSWTSAFEKTFTSQQVASEPAPSIRDRLAAHSERVGASIQSDLAEGRLNVVFPGLDQVTAKRVYKAAIDTVVAAMDAGERIGKGINKAIVAVKKELGSRFTPEAENELKRELRRNAPTAFEEHRTRTRKTEELSRREAMGDGSYPEEPKPTEWKDYQERTTERATKVFEDIKSTKAVKEVAQKLGDTRRELFTSKSSVAHEVAEGSMPGTTKSETAKSFVDDALGSKPGAEGTATNGADSDMNRAITRRANKLDSILKGLQPRMERMGEKNRQAFLSRIGDLLTSEIADLTKEPPDVQKAIGEIREFFDKVREDLQAAGYDVGDFGANSMPRIFDADMRTKNPDEFHRDLVETYKAKFKREITEAEARGATDEAEKLRKQYTDAKALKRALAYENSLSMNEAGIATNGDDFKLQGDDGLPNFLKGREFGEEADRLLGKYYVRNPFEVAKVTAEHSERLITLARVLGKVDPKTQRLDRLRRWNDVVNSLREEGNEKMVPELARIISATFGLGNRPAPKWQKFSEFTRTWMWLSFLDRATVSSLSEPLLAGINSRSVANAAKSFGITLKQSARRLAKLPPNELQIIAEQLGYVQSGLMSRLASAHASDPFASGAMAKTADGFFSMTGLTGWTHSTAEAALDIGMDYLATLAKLSKSSKLAARDLRSLGIDPSEFATLDGFADNLRKGNRLAEITGDSPGAAIMRKGLDIWMRRSALNPTQGDKALHAAHPVGNMFYGLQSFLYTYTKHVSGKLLRDMRAAIYEKDLSAGERAKLAAGLPAAMLGMGAANFAITMLREAIFQDPERKKKDTKKSKEEILQGRLLASASRANFLGPYDPLFNAIVSAKYQRDPATVMVGPVWGAASELFGELANQGGGRDSPNTNTSERKIAKLAYNIGAKPAMSAVLSGLPATRTAGVLNYGISHPFTRDSVVSGVAGPMKSPQQAKRKKGPMPEF